MSDDLTFEVMWVPVDSGGSPRFVFAAEREPWKPAAPPPGAWSEAMRSARRERRLLFDGPLFRLFRIDGRPSHLDLHLERTSYRAYVETREGRSSWSPEADRAYPLAVCAILETSDGLCVTERRSGLDGHLGRRHIIGGWVDPDRDRHPDPRHAMAREIEEELGMSPPVPELRILGLAFDRVLSHPEICFYGGLDVPSTSLAGLAGDGEVSSLEGFPLDSSQVLVRLGREPFTPTAQAALWLLGTERWGTEWGDQARSRLARAP